jgi:hypothetical protein
MNAAVHPFGIKSVVRSPTVWSPWALDSALVAWWSAEDLVDGAVAAWMSRKGGFNPVQGTGGSQPTRAATSFNGFPGVTFDGADDQLTLGNTTNLPTSTTEGEIWFLGSWASSAGTVVSIGYGGTAGGNIRLIQKIAAGEAARVSDGTISQAMASGVGNHIVGGFFGSAALNGRMNGVAFGPAAATLSTGTTRLRIGANTANTAAQFHNGVVAEAIITTGLLSTANRERIEGYWAWRYGLMGNLPALHTYREARPVV